MLTIQNLSAGYGKVQVLHGISIEVPKGKVVTLIGSNGAGKTTTMRAVSGISASTAWRAFTSPSWAWPIRPRAGACSRP